MMILINVAYHHIHSTIDAKHRIRLSSEDFMPIFQQLKFKMKIGYTCWKKGLFMHDHLFKTIERTVKEKFRLAKKQTKNFFDQQITPHLLHQEQQQAQSDSHKNLMSKKIFEELIRSACTVPVETSVSHFLHKFSLTASLKNRLLEHMHHYSATLNQTIEIARIHKASHVRQMLHQLSKFVLAATYTEENRSEKISSSVSFYLRKTKKALSSTIIKRALDSYSLDDRPFFYDFMTGRFDEKTVKQVVTNFLYICMLKAKKHQNLILFNINRNVDFFMIKRHDLQKFKILKTYRKL